MLENQKRLLVVDDESVVVEFMSRALSKQGFAVDVASNGEAAKSLLEINEYELVIIDIRMPKMNGKEFFEYLKTFHPKMSNRVIFTSGELIDDGMITFLYSENRPFLYKPFGTEALKEAVGKILRNMA